MAQTVELIAKNNIMYHYKIHLHKEAEGGFMVTVPALPGCITQGDDIEEAIAMAKEAIELYIEELKERGEDIPDDSNTIECSLNLETA
jgi:predicted RNase H-like HicB family nuclease